MRLKLLGISEVVQGVSIGGMIVVVVLMPLELWDADTMLQVIASFGSINAMIQSVLWIWRKSLKHGG